MANQFGYNQTFTDKPEMWTIDGYAVCTDSLGTLVIVTHQLTTKGTVSFVQSLSPTSAVSAITQTASNSGIYDIFLAQTWFQCESADVRTVIPASLSPAYVGVQLNSDTVGNNSFGPGLAKLQSLRFTTNVGGTPTSLPVGAGIYFQLRLKNSSA